MSDNPPSIPPEFDELLDGAVEELREYRKSATAIHNLDQGAAELTDLVRSGMAFFLKLGASVSNKDEKAVIVEGLAMRIWVEGLPETSKNLLVRGLLSFITELFLRDMGYAGDAQRYIDDHAEGRCNHGGAEHNAWVSGTTLGWPARDGRPES